MGKAVSSLAGLTKGEDSSSLVLVGERVRVCSSLSSTFLDMLMELGLL